MEPSAQAESGAPAMPVGEAHTRAAAGSPAWTAVAAPAHSPHQSLALPTAAGAAGTPSPLHSQHLLPPAAVSPALASALAAPLPSASPLAVTPGTGSSAAGGGAGALGSAGVPTSPTGLVGSLKAAANVWRAIDLDARRAQIDASALAMGDEESRAQLARKALAEQTKAWKRLPSDAERAAQLGPLVRGYQEEINQLTRRSSASESAFLELYRLLLDAPDPFHLLSTAITELEHASGVEEALRLARATLAEFEAEFAGLKNQDITIRRLEADKRELETNMRALVAQQVAAQMREGEEQMEAAKQAFEERERMLEAKLHSYKEQLSAALASQSSLAAAALSRERWQDEKAEQAAQGDLRWLESEVERQSLELTRKEQEIAALRTQLAAATEVQEDGAAGGPMESSGSSFGAAGRRGASDALSELDRAHFEAESAALLSRAEAAESLSASLQAQVSSLSEALSAAHAEATSRATAMQASINSLQEELAARPETKEVEDLKRQVRDLQEIQYGSRSDEAEAGSSSTSGSSKPGGSSSADPTAVLLSKSRRLESELTALKRAHASLQDEHATLTQQQQVTALALDDAKQLLARMEEELAVASAAAAGTIAATSTAMAHHALTGSSLHAQPPPNFHPSALSAAGTTSPAVGASSPLITVTPAAASGLYVDTGASPASNVTAAAKASAFSPSTAPPTLSSLQSALSQAQSMLTIVLAQRDRYRARADALEASAAAASEEAARLRDSSAALKKDNMALYEKLQYVKSHAGGGGGGGGDLTGGGGGGDEEAGFGGVGAGTLARSGDGERGAASSASESKYAQLYEARLNPFSAFRRRAREEREAALSTSERWTLALGRALFSRAGARKALFVYAAVLHLLVMVVLWTHSVSDHCASDGAAAGTKVIARAHPH